MFSFEKTSHFSINCRRDTLVEMRSAKRRQLNTTTTETHKKAVYNNFSKHYIRNAFTEFTIIVSALIHGPYHMMPSELLYVSGS